MREKLIELLYDAHKKQDKICFAQKSCFVCELENGEHGCEAPFVVDYLIANGVVVREKGEWIPHNDGRTRFMCSNCKSRNHPGGHLFCCVCGADMRGGQK